VNQATVASTCQRSIGLLLLLLYYYASTLNILLCQLCYFLSLNRSSRRSYDGTVTIHEDQIGLRNNRNRKLFYRLLSWAYKFRLSALCTWRPKVSSLYSLLKNLRYQDDNILNHQDCWSEVEMTALCACCRCPILDRYVLEAVPGLLQWHTACLRCAYCGQLIDETSRTCFIRHHSVYCSPDFYRYR